MINVIHGDCLVELPKLSENSIDSCVTDPPYHLTSIVKRFGNAGAAPAKGNDAFKRASAGFMGKTWDGGDIAFRVETWSEVFRVLKPGAHLLAFSGTRTYHRMVCAIEDAGFEIRDQIGWLYGSGFPKSHNISKAIDRMNGAEREVIGIAGRSRKGGGDICTTGMTGGEYYETKPSTEDADYWSGWGTALKPAWEPIVLARKPLSEGTVARNVLEYGTGALNIDGCRISCDGGSPSIKRREAGAPSSCRPGEYGYTILNRITPERYEQPHSGEELGRWPANVCHDGSDEVLDCLEASRFFSSHQVTEEDLRWPKNHANCAEEYLSLRSAHVVSALAHAAEGSTLTLELLRASYRAQNTNVSEKELKLLCESVTEAIQNLERRSLLGLQQTSITVTLGSVKCAAEKTPTGTMIITISLLRLDGFAEAVTFSTIKKNTEVGEQVCQRRFHYSAKADKADRLGSNHPTVKPVDLMRWLVRMITPQGGVVLDPFGGSGTTAMAAMAEGFDATLIELEEQSVADIKRRICHVRGDDTPLFAADIREQTLL